MRLLSAFANLWRGFVSIFIADTAVAFPEATYRGQIQKGRETHDKLLNAAGMIKGSLIRETRKLDELVRDLAATEAQLRVAVRRVAGGDEKMKEAGSLLQRKAEGLRKQRDEQQPMVDSLKKQVEQVLRDLRRSEAYIKDLDQRMRINLARLQSAEQRQRMQNLLSGLSVEGDQQAITELEAAIDQKVGRADLQDEIAEGSVERQLEVIQEQTGDAVAMDEFERLVAEERGKQGVSAAVSPATTPDGSPGGKSV